MSFSDLGTTGQGRKEGQDDAGGDNLHLIAFLLATLNRIPFVDLLATDWVLRVSGSGKSVENGERTD